ncbi:hypothetical protein C8A05DRAFT_37611 [Staphylotrichum tortipilum]|uniref:Dihydroorotate dehydrogenase catalytic domain-containing protein n=1 Tax=Staphylotrichum tortipilum TaxID=2831512 RepID=A0AAN6RQ16_9PEZI|nr:hypothetical protein C8A05DRAFT_37611 [Staphylotrichum longicolle]
MDAEIPDPLFALGAGVVEVGGCTPLPQDGNPRPRVFRIPALDGLVNRYGLNSRGADAMAARLRDRLWKFARGLGLTVEDMMEGAVEGIPTGSLQPGRLLCVQIAKNKKTNEKDMQAVIDDHVSCVKRLAPYADVLVVNVSSPNTPGLRDLQAAEPLARLLGAVVDEAKRTHRKVKPRVMASGVDGVIVGNTTKRRTGLIPNGVRLTGAEQKALAEEGGFSGPAMFDRTLSLVGRYRKMLDSYSLKTPGVDDVFPPQKVIFATGGITNGEQALKVLNAGASVAMVYTGLVYGGSGTSTTSVQCVGSGGRETFQTVTVCAPATPATPTATASADRQKLDRGNACVCNRNGCDANSPACCATSTCPACNCGESGCFNIDLEKEPITLEVTSYMNNDPQRAYASADAGWGRRSLEDTKRTYQSFDLYLTAGATKWSSGNRDETKLPFCRVGAWEEGYTLSNIGVIQDTYDPPAAGFMERFPGHDFYFTAERTNPEPHPGACHFYYLLSRFLALGPLGVVSRAARAPARRNTLTTLIIATTSKPRSHVDRRSYGDTKRRWLPIDKPIPFGNMSDQFFFDEPAAGPEYVSSGPTTSFTAYDTYKYNGDRLGLYLSLGLLWILGLSKPGAPAFGLPVFEGVLGRVEFWVDGARRERPVYEMDRLLEALPLSPRTEATEDGASGVRPEMEEGPESWRRWAAVLAPDRGEPMLEHWHLGTWETRRDAQAMYLRQTVVKRMEKSLAAWRRWVEGWRREREAEVEALG